jgi:hypothetical protein
MATAPRGQVESAAERRRERFLADFTQSNKFKELRNRLKMAIFRIAVEKYKKEVSAQSPLGLEERTKFKANLYILLQQVMQYTLKKAMTNGATSKELHPDITQ